MIPTIALCSIYFVGALATARYITDAPSYDPADRSCVVCLLAFSLLWPIYWPVFGLASLVLLFILRVSG